MPACPPTGVARGSRVSLIILFGVAPALRRDAEKDYRARERHDVRRGVICKAQGDDDESRDSPRLDDDDGDDSGRDDDDSGLWVSDDVGAAQRFEQRSARANRNSVAGALLAAAALPQAARVWGLAYQPSCGRRARAATN